MSVALRKMILCGALLLLPPAARAQNLSPLGDVPDYRRLDPYQETMTREEFVHGLETLYAPRGGWQAFIRADAEAAIVRKTSVPLDDLYTLRFAADGAHRRPLPAASWRPRAALPPTNPPVDRPLAGVRVAIDPGHLGGRWARMEERWFRLGDSAPVMEGELTLLTAHRLADRLRALGAARVDLVRDRTEPTTPLRPSDLVEQARFLLSERGVRQPPALYDGPLDPNRPGSVLWNAENLFTRADIRARAWRVNDDLRPDLVLCLHYNAEAWGDPAAPELVPRNHLHLLVNGCYEPDEIARDDVRCEMLWRLLARTGPEELAAARPVAAALATATGLPAYQYTGLNAIPTGNSPYVWARNLLANRLYACPVVYCEPYVMNSPEVFARAQAGDYEGTRDFGGVQRKSLVREYADAVADGLAEYYRSR